MNALHHFLITDYVEEDRGRKKQVDKYQLWRWLLWYGDDKVIESELCVRGEGRTSGMAIEVWSQVQEQPPGIWKDM